MTDPTVPATKQQDHHADLADEVARLRAEVEALRAERSGLGYSREADDPTPVSPARVPLHTGSVIADGVLVTDKEMR